MDGRGGSSQFGDSEVLSPDTVLASGRRFDVLLAVASNQIVGVLPVKSRPSTHPPLLLSPPPLLPPWPFIPRRSAPPVKQCDRNIPNHALPRLSFSSSSSPQIFSPPLSTTLIQPSTSCLCHFFALLNCLDIFGCFPMSTHLDLIVLSCYFLDLPLSTTYIFLIFLVNALILLFSLVNPLIFLFSLVNQLDVVVLPCQLIRFCCSCLPTP